jgi:DNA (cytosine-5)-methyltransferase 1
VGETISGGDLFCGGGGSSTGLVEACQELGRPIDLVAVNHWPTAIATHRRNHPWARHYCEEIRRVNPRDAVPSGHLDILLAGAPCPHFSIARGGRPMNRRERATPRQILRWYKDLDVDAGLIENVAEFTSWGALDSKGYPIKKRAGEYYRQFIGRLVDMGYTVEDRILNAADYGAATTRKRLFIMIKKGRIKWPEPTHDESTWRPAREIIDWSIPGKSIFNRERPLSKNTIRRIAVGIERFVPDPLRAAFLVMLYGTGTARSLDRPLPTVMSGGGRGGGHIALCEFLLQQQSGGVVRDVSKPAPTIASSGAQALVDACLIPFYGERDGQTPRTHSIDQPVPVIPATGNGKFAKVDFVVQVNHGGKDGGRVNSIDEPMKTIASKNGFGLASFIVKYYKTGVPHGLGEPMPTVTAKDRVGLVECGGTSYGLDIRLRMLQPHELAAAMSFPEGYHFEGTRADQVRQIGNAWDVNIGRALCRALLAS